MGLLEGKNALVFGVANDHSIAWGIAQALHAEGASVGFSSIESLIEKRVRPLAESIGSTFVEPADVQSDADIERVFARWGETTDHLDILVHALAFAKRRTLQAASSRHRGTGSRWRWTCRRIRWLRSRARRGPISCAPARP